ncbi:small multi-drug export protein [Sulfurovum sp. CS9]|uniref:small multi-drug export protein n=1 Tax=Sulfurovum sp. CS9 TaxID=3391146 RepID=UPI0039EAB78B
MKTKHSFFKHKEGHILILGLTLLGCFFILLLLSALFFPNYLQLLLSITATNIIFGRISGLSIGIASQMDTTLLIAFNIFIESIMVLILYPLFVLSWNKLYLISYQPLNQFLERSKVTAHKYKPIIKRYGVIGLFLFVLTPFAMTGPVIASFVGFLIGFRHHVTLLVVLSSTLIAIIIWFYLIKNFEEILIAYSDILMMGFLIAATMMLVWYLLKKYFYKSTL